MMHFNKDALLNTMAEVLKGSIKFKMLKDGNVETILNYMRFIVTSESMMKNFLNDLINIAKGIGYDAIIHYEMKLALYDRKQKLDLNNKLT
jgi:hypothetical protein